jgi:guanylate cyclase
MMRRQIWVLAAPIVALIIHKPRYTIRWGQLAALSFIVTALWQPYLPDNNHLPSSIITLMFLTNLLGVSVALTLPTYYFVNQRDQAFRLLHVEQERSENLLLNILPKEIVAILKNENRVIADHYDGASILFADIVNFTPMSAQLTPVQLVELLNEIFSHFDGLVEKYGLEKIKTIGDCYMVAAGVPRPRADHAQALARLALEMQAFVREREFSGQRIAFRIGINSGPVIAGVIGRKKFIYDLWGDAVNTASRMESHSTGGAIQITRATYELLKNDFNCESRGMMQVKGKGEMDVWHIMGEQV